MRFMIIRKGDAETEAGTMPSRELAEKMMAYHEEMGRHLKILGGDGLKPTSAGAKVRFRKNKPMVIDGPFTETKELVSGYWVFEVSSREEAIEWAKKAPFRGGELEIRPFSTAEDFGEAFTPELQEKENALRETVAQQRGR